MDTSGKKDICFISDVLLQAVIELRLPRRKHPAASKLDDATRRYSPNLRRSEL